MFFWILVFFILGSAVGSFLNVVIDRATHGESILGRSYCDHCRKTLAPLDLVPIVSFLALSAKCRHCKGQISWQYPLVETATGVLFAFSFLRLTQLGQLGIITLAYYFFLVSVIIIVAVIDIKFSLIPTTLVFLASLISLFYNYFFLSSPLFVEHVLAAFGAAVFFAAIVLITRGKGMGEGDIVISFLIGMVLGQRGTIVAIFLGFFTGALISLLLIVLNKKHFGQTIPFAPFLALGFLIAFFWANEIINWYLMIY